VRVLVLGSGGRENALAWGLSRSPSVLELLCAPGNPGMEALAEVTELDIEDGTAVLEKAREFAADLVVIGPEAPLVAGVADSLTAAGIKVFGASAPAARIEGSKAYAKELMEAAGIPTGSSRVFSEPQSAIAYIDELGPPYVIKADGLAAGKGVVVTSDRTDAIEAIEDRLVRGLFGAAGNRVLIEEFLDGQEASLIAFVDGRNAIVCEPAQDYKRVADGDRGPNTGGMGSYSPVPACPTDVCEAIASEVIEPMVAELSRRGTPFVGALYAGVALTSKGPKVIEFNARFGDPETQALIPRLQTDLGSICAACASGEVSGLDIRWSADACVSVVLASQGYPGPYETGGEVTGTEEAARRPGVAVFHAGTKRDADRLVTSGGRVLAVSALGNTFSDARNKAYEAAELISFDGKHVRTDIAARAQEKETS
jgi:phosphoribosylamine---glycine ligase